MMKGESKSIGGYDKLIHFADDNGYSDQGSILSANGGMTADKLQELAKVVYGTKLKNAYSKNKDMTAVMCKLLDEGKKLIVLCSQKNSEIVEKTDSHILSW